MEKTEGQISTVHEDFETTELLFTYSEEQKQRNEKNAENAKRLFTPEFIPYYLRESKAFGLTPLQSIIYGFVRFYCANSGGRFYFEDEDLEKILPGKSGSINNCIARLKKVGLIETTRRVKAGGGTIRFISRVHCLMYLDSTEKWSLTPLNNGLHLNKNKINKNKINSANEILKDPDTQKWLELKRKGTLIGRDYQTFSSLDTKLNQRYPVFRYSRQWDEVNGL